MPSLDPSVPTHRDQGPCLSAWNLLTPPDVNQILWTVPVFCPLCLAEAVTPQCGFPSETSLQPRILQIFRAPEDAHSHLEKSQNSAGCDEPRATLIPSWLWGREVGVGGGQDWGLGGPRVPQEDPKSNLSHGAVVPHLPLHPHLLLTCTSPGQVKTQWVALGRTPSQAPPAGRFSLLCVLPFLLGGA